MVVSIQVVVHRKLEDAGAALLRDDGAVGKEEDPAAVPAFTILFDDL
jgi:hypothetical protein